MQGDRWRASEMATDRVERNAVKWSGAKTLDLDLLAPLLYVGSAGRRFRKIWNQFPFSLGQETGRMARG